MADWFWIASAITWTVVLLFVLLDEPIDRWFARRESKRYMKKKCDK